MFQQAAESMARADALLVTAGAGMGVDSGLPDFRGTEGFWRAYPPLAALGLRFEEVADPRWFDRDPELAWGFYGHRLNLYRQTQPHAGFQILRDWAEKMPRGAGVFTSNVDGHFQRAGFDVARLEEHHGSLNHLQCSGPCGEEIWRADDVEIFVDEDSFRAEEPLPRCPHCGAMARPNVLMFGDGRWVWNRSEAQRERLQAWLETLENAELVVIECGAGTAIPSVRRFSEGLQSAGATLVRINPREAHGPPGTVSIESGALAALQAIAALL